MSPTMVEQEVGTKSAKIPRRYQRFPFTGEAEVTAAHTGRHMTANVAEISLHGCYLDTPEPFKAGTKVNLRVRHAGRCCEIPGRVLYAHGGWGMGIQFGDPTPEAQSMLDGWIAEMERCGAAMFAH